MKLREYLMLYKSNDFDIYDNEIENKVTVCWTKDKADEVSKDFPYMDLFCYWLYKKVDIDYCRPDGSPICKFTSLILNNKDRCLAFAKKEWGKEYYDAVKDDDIELCYQFIKEFDNVVGGRYGETMNKAYYNLIKGCTIKQDLSLN